jgi:hypothetical protein
MHRDPMKTWQYFAHAVIREDDQVKLTYLMRELYRTKSGHSTQNPRKGQ